MKNTGIKYRSLSLFLTFYQTLKCHFSNFNVFIRDEKDITKTDFSETASLLPNSDTTNFMKNVMHSFLSKEGAFTDFLEGPQALSLTSNDRKALHMLLGRAHVQMEDMWA